MALGISHPNSTVAFNIKGLTWVTANSRYENDFANGKFMHSFLSPSDYHRFQLLLVTKCLNSRPGLLPSCCSDGTQRLGPAREIELEGLDNPGPGSWSDCNRFTKSRKSDFFTSWYVSSVLRAIHHSQRS